MKLKITLLLFLSFTTVFSQKKEKFNYKKAASDGNLNYFQIIEKKKNEIKTYDLTKLSNRKEIKHFNRWVYFWKDRVDINGKFPNSNLGYYNAKILTENGKINQNLSRSLSTETWTNVGPQNLPDPNGYSNPPQMGRLNTFLRIKHPTDRNQDVLFVGAPNGGVWKSTDGGTSWNPKLDMVAGIGVTDIKTTSDATFANYTTKPIYVSTGDYDGGNVSSIGVLKSTDGGETFVSTGLSYNESEGQVLGQLIVVDANTVLVGARDNIKITTDGGTNWTNNFDPGYTNAGFGRVAVSGSKAMYIGYFDVIYTNDFMTGNWTTVIAKNDDSRNAVTVGEDGKFYIQGLDGQIKQFNESNNTFSNYGTIPPNYNPQGGFNQTLIVKNNMIISGEVNATSSTNNGASWYNSMNGYWDNNTSDGVYVHSDHHAMGFLDGTYEFWSVNDGGLHFVDYGNDPANQKPTVNYKSSKVIVTQAYSVAINPSANDGAYVMANQDNDAFSKRNGIWYSVSQGDGIQSAINYNNPDIRYAGNQGGHIMQTDTGFQGQLNGNGEEVSVPGASFYFPLEMNKTNPNILFAGGDDIYKIEDNSGLSITKLNAGIGKITDIATHGNSVFVTGETGHKFSTDNGANWTNIPPGASINSVDFDASNNQVLYVTKSGYTDGEKVFKSTDGGANFTNISGDLPNIVMKEVMLKQGQGTEYLFLATELGVYFTTNGGTNWKKLGNGLPNVDVRDIEIHYTNDKLVAATFGRGLWEINIANSTLSTGNLSKKETKLSLYPNPTVSNYLNLTLDTSKKYSYLIYNVIGGIVMKGKLDANHKIDITNLPKNVYVIRVFNDSTNLSTKFIKGKD